MTAVSVGVVPERASQVPSQLVEAATTATAGACVRRRSNELAAAGRLSTPGAVGPSPYRRLLVVRRHRRRRRRRRPRPTSRGQSRLPVRSSWRHRSVRAVGGDSVPRLLQCRDGPRRRQFFTRASLPAAVSVAVFSHTQRLGWRDDLWSRYRKFYSRPSTTAE